MRDKKFRSVLGAGAAGVFMAFSQAGLASNRCSVPASGHCSACGSCLVVVAGLSSWALWRMRGRRQLR